MRRLLLSLVLCACISSSADQSTLLTSVAELPANVDRLIAEKRFDEALAACETTFQKDPDAWASVLPQVARIHEAAGRPADAARALRKLVASGEPTMAAIEHLTRAVSLYTAAGNSRAAIRTQEELLALYPRAVADYQRSAAMTQYARNRKGLDIPVFAAGIGGAIAGAHDAAGDADAAAAARLRMFRTYPDEPGLRALALQVARDCARRSDWHGALGACCRVLDYSGDRCHTHRTKLADNQAYLDAVSTPNDEATLTDVLRLASRACSELDAAQALSDDEVGRIASVWATAEREAYDVVWLEDWGRGGHTSRPSPRSVLREPEGTQVEPSPRDAWTRLVDECRATVLDPLAHLSLADWLNWRGLYEEARRHYLIARDGARGMPGIQDRVAFGLGELSLHTGDFATARDHFIGCADAWEGPLAAEAALRAAECLEFQGLVE